MSVSKSLSTSFFRYPGGKSKLREIITNRLILQANKHTELEYREPFFGGGSIGLKLLSDNPMITKLWMNDKDIGIACLWTSVIKSPTEFKKLVESFIPSIDAFFSIRKELLEINEMPTQTECIIDIGFKKLAIHQISYSGLGTKSGGPLGGIEQKSDYKIDCRWSPIYICKKIDKLHKWFSSIEIHDRQCSNLDFLDLINDRSCQSLLYLDPPYFDKGSDLYQHSFQYEDHERLMFSLMNTKHSWILSYDDCAEIRELYDWAKIENLNVNYSITATKNKTTGDRLSQNKSELLISRKED